MQVLRAFVGAQIFDGDTLQTDAALLAEPDGAARIVPQQGVPEEAEQVALDGGVITPGFVDLQVNGGGGVMVGDAPSLETLARIAAAHRRLGTHALLPTLITDTPAQTAAVIQAATDAVEQKVPGVFGLHLEGPHLSQVKKGAHDAGLIRPMSDEDLRLLLKSAERLEHLMITVAPEAVELDQISALAKAGVTVALGHSDTSYDAAMRAFDAGARVATHLFNAMSQMTAREPGLVGAALTHGTVFAGLIADGVHVHPATMKTALAAKPDGVFLVTDAMAVAGTAETSFTLGGRRISRAAGRLTLQDGTLAGADIDFPGMLRVLHQDGCLPLERALRMATSLPASVMQATSEIGRFTGRMDGLIYLADDFAEITQMPTLLA